MPTRRGRRSCVAAAEFTGEFFLTQIVSHHHAARVEQFVRALERQRRPISPACSASSTTAARSRRRSPLLREFLPVPVDELTREFAAGATPIEVCARTVRTLIDAGAKHFYMSNLPLGRTSETLAEILTASVSGVASSQ